MVFLYLFVLGMLFGLTEAQASDECDKSHNCLTCAGVPYNCASCPKGYYLARGGAYYTCRSCPIACSECEHYMICTKCYLEGRYGQNCQDVCSKGCLDSTCEHSSGTCLCRDNYEGGHCDYCAKGKYDIDSDCVKDCPQNCKTCTSYDKCTECKDGFFGDACEFNCSRGCYLGRCSQMNGTCYQEKCNPNFDGINCTTCFPGFYGTYCQLPCPESCVACSGNTSCDHCQHGHWGSACQHKCSIGCYKSMCLKKTGVCMYSKCRTGFIGEKCDICDLGKHGTYCNMTETLNGNGSSAMKLTGHSSKYTVVIMGITLFSFTFGLIEASCPKRYYLARGGAYYTCRACPIACSECKHYMFCTKCYLEGRYGQSCQDVCSKGCLNSTCEHSSGTCLCRDNYEGGHCDYCAKGKYDIDSDCVKDCPQNCKTCTSYDKCTECKDGFFGDVCEFNCSRGCYLGRCSQMDGTCYQKKCNPNFDGINCTTCSPGLHGSYCQLPCPNNCVACSGNTSCDYCQHGYWGTDCQLNCSIGCYKSSCLKKTGVCMYSKCKTGFIGEKCDICVLGKHGNYCNMTETLNGNGSSAMKLTGHSSKYTVVIMVITLFRLIV
ncbi:multiple epidermal growth factor-like domains protein 10 [Ruditapes philippinarum]|uniref:multiple epidermal growth factor-like domains protein 10 n=1 Tax=Ruditapes philippinarum TaxID=129788 RepID=UPI00295AAE8E|nr:multiple epidermal growth factor-like domains protein 10 [Ruditapes philippinarum]